MDIIFLQTSQYCTWARGRDPDSVQISPEWMPAKRAPSWERHTSVGCRAACGGVPQPWRAPTPSSPCPWRGTRAAGCTTPHARATYTTTMVWWLGEQSLLIWRSLKLVFRIVTFWYESRSGSVPLDYGSGSCSFIQKLSSSVPDPYIFITDPETHKTLNYEWYGWQINYGSGSYPHIFVTTEKNMLQKFILLLRC